MRNPNSVAITLRLPRSLLGLVDQLVEKRRSEQTLDEYLAANRTPNRSSVIRDLLKQCVDQNAAPEPQPVETN